MLNLYLPTVETQRLVLRPIELKDAADMYEYASDDMTIEWLSFQKHQSVEESQQIIKDLFLTRPDKGIPQCYAMVLKENGKMIGTCDIHSIDRFGSGEIGYVCNRKYWNQGYVSEATKKLIEVAFTSIGLERLEIKHAVENKASQRVIEKCGFVFEGVKRSYLPKRSGGTTDAKIYSILKKEHEVENYEERASKEI